VSSPGHISNNINARISQVLIHATSSPTIMSSMNILTIFLIIDSIVVLVRNSIDWNSKQIFQFIYYIHLFISTLLSRPGRKQQRFDRYGRILALINW
jgi:hypothetical protein